MLVALVNDTRREPESSGERAECPECLAPVVGKCGSRTSWHWAHLTTPDPLLHDSWRESEGAWHREWKSRLAGGDPSKMEVRVTDPETGVYHIADVLTDGWVIELQHSYLSDQDIEKREAFYSKHCEGILWFTDRKTLPKYVSAPSIFVEEVEVGAGKSFPRLTYYGPGGRYSMFPDFFMDTLHNKGVRLLLDFLVREVRKTTRAREADQQRKGEWLRKRNLDRDRMLADYNGWSISSINPVESLEPRRLSPKVKPACVDIDALLANATEFTPKKPLNIDALLANAPEFTPGGTLDLDALLGIG